MVRYKLECHSVAGKSVTVTEANKLKIIRQNPHFFPTIYLSHVFSIIVSSS